MTLVAHAGAGSAPPYQLLDGSPVGSRIVIHYRANVRTVYRKQPNGLWRGTNWVPGRRPTTFAAELSSRVFSVFDQEPWRLHHPGILHVGVSVSGARFWLCLSCADVKRPFDSIPEAADDARAHIRIHIEAAQAEIRRRFTGRGF